ncbi:MAG: ABC transporter substrate-binding protein [Proteobacteria bacterium]|nr:ABC transporter substrate-binding protein [Pseudomonadota bacterium]
MFRMSFHKLSLLFAAAFCLGCGGSSGTNIQNATAESLTQANSTAPASNTASHAQIDSKTNSTSTQASTTSWSVDDPNHPTQKTPEVVAAELAEQAMTAIQNSAYEQAFKLAIKSFVESPTEEARNVATYAASQLTPIELKRLGTQAETHIELAIIGQLRANVCASQNDSACLEQIIPETAQALEAIGDNEAAQQLRSLQNGVNTSRPLVAVFLPLSGNDRKIGRAMLGAILQASGIYNHRALPFDLRFFDTKTSAESIDAMLADVRKSSAKLIIGPVDILECRAVSQKLDAQTIMIGLSPNGEFIQNKPNVFQFSYSIKEEAQKAAQFVVSANAKNVVAIGPDDEYTKSSAQQLQISLPSTVSFETVTFPANQADLRDLASKVAKKSPDLIYYPTSADMAERIASFMAQENIWCKLPGTPQPNPKVDTRRFVSCLAPGAWAPISDGHGYKVINDAIYLDYTEAAESISAGFSDQFQSLYHRQPAVQEILPFVALSMLKSMPDSAWQSPESLQTAVESILRGHQYLMLPGFRQVMPRASKAWAAPLSDVPARTLITTK